MIAYKDIVNYKKLKILNWITYIDSVIKIVSKRLNIKAYVIGGSVEKTE